MSSFVFCKYLNIKNIVIVFVIVIVIVIVIVVVIVIVITVTVTVALIVIVIGIDLYHAAAILSPRGTKSFVFARLASH